jgi:hypothetical protein
MNIKRGAFGNKFLVLSIIVVSLFLADNALTKIWNPCTVIAYANANTYIQGPSYSQTISFAFDSTVNIANCNSTNLLSAATIIVSNPSENPPPTAPVYMNLVGDTGTSNSSQLLLMQGNTVITQADFPSWFPDNTVIPSTDRAFTGLTITCPSTPWVPSSITIIWQ